VPILEGREHAAGLGLSSPVSRIPLGWPPTLPSFLHEQKERYGTRSCVEKTVRPALLRDRPAGLRSHNDPLYLQLPLFSDLRRLVLSIFRSSDDGNTIFCGINFRTHLREEHGRTRLARSSDIMTSIVTLGTSPFPSTCSLLVLIILVSNIRALSVSQSSPSIGSPQPDSEGGPRVGLAYIHLGDNLQQQ
jgi:hypothetical protein